MEHRKQGDVLRLEQRAEDGAKEVTLAGGVQHLIAKMSYRSQLTDKNCQEFREVENLCKFLG